MNKLELVEFAVYHWIFGGNHNFPALNENGVCDSSFFEGYPKKASYENGQKFLLDDIELIPSWLDKDLNTEDVKRKYDNLSKKKITFYIRF